MNENCVTISDIRFTPVESSLGHIGFVSFVFNGNLFLSSIAVYTRPGGGFRLVFPRVKNINVFYPINKNVYIQLETEIAEYLARVFKDVRHDNGNSPKI